MDTKTDFVELKKMQEVFALIRQTPKPRPGKRIVAFDLDNTVVMPTQLVGSDHWFRQHVAREENLTGSSELARLNSLKIYKDVQKKTQVKHVEPDTSKIIQLLQEEDNIVIGLTARNKETIEDTNNQLLSLDINFNQGILKDRCVPCKSNLEMGIFKNGIMFAAFSNKGLALKGLIEDLQLDISDVFFIDDSARNVNDVIKDSGVPCTGIYYTHITTSALTVDLNISDVQIQYLNKILPDPIAKTIHEHHEAEKSNLYFNITFKQKQDIYKPYAYFWLNQKKDLDSIETYFKAEQCHPKVKHDYYAFKPDCPILAKCTKVPLEKAAPLVAFLYEHQVLKQHDVKQAKIKISEVSHLSKFSVK